jgi:LuxR family maltose regulon positive regulatory protein
MEEDQPPLVILRSKVALPVLRPEHVSRPRLVAALESGELRRLTVIEAPAGFGKTRLLVEWCRGRPPAAPIAWLSLDEFDNDPVTFWTYIVHALRAALPGRFGRSLDALAQPNASLTRAVLPPLLNELWEAGDDTWLVLDDFHVIADVDCIESFRFFIDRLPPMLHIILATRSDPPLGLARLRARGMLTELRAADLRFTLDEAATFLNGSLGLDLSHDDLDQLQERTEGWAAGLYLAALSLRDHPDPRGFIATFAGQARHLVDYVGGEVLDRLSEADREFLVQTAILEQVTAPLCNTVLESDDAAARLRAMAQRNLFVFPLDEAWTWYRYHPLFRELLLVELERRFPERIPVLHRRAAAWYRAAGDAPAAMHHALAAPAPDLAGDLFLAHAVVLMQQARLATVKGWLEALPDEAIASRPPLGLAAAWIAGQTGYSSGVVTRRIATAAAGPDVGPFFLGEHSLAAAVALTRSTFPVDDVGGAVADGERAVADASDPNTWSFLLARAALGRALYLAGRAAEAQPVLEEALRAPLAGQQVAGTTRAMATLALVCLELGEEARAGELARRSVRTYQDWGISISVGPWLNHVALSMVLVREGRLEEAEATLAEGVEPLLDWLRGWPLFHALALLALAPVRHGLGHTGAARALVEEARAALRGCPGPGMLPARLAEVERGLGRQPRRVTGLREDLSEAELRILRLLASDLTQREIGRELYLSVNTVKSHTRAIYTKLDAASRPEAVARARALRLIA